MLPAYYNLRPGRPLAVVKPFLDRTKPPWRDYFFWGQELLELGAVVAL